MKKQAVFLAMGLLCAILAMPLTANADAKSGETLSPDVLNLWFTGAPTPATFTPVATSFASGGNVGGNCTDGTVTLESSSFGLPFAQSGAYTPVPPTAAFGVSDSSGDAPLTVTFTDQSEGGFSAIASYRWDFKDGSAVDTTASPVHTFTDAGTYVVALTVVDEFGEETTTQTITVNAPPAEGAPVEGAPIEGQPIEGQPIEGQPVEGEPIPVAPTASFSESVTEGLAPLTVQFTDTSAPGTSAITAWAWNFGDDVTDTVQNPEHTYTQPGVYDVSLSVTTADGVDAETLPGLITAWRYNVPNVVGMTRTQAETAITAAGLTLGAVTEQWSETVPSGNVISQNVAVGYTLDEVASVPLTVSKGKVTGAYLYGDVNMDGVITSADYGAMVLAQSSSDPVVRALADVTHDGAVDSSDTKRLLSYLRSGGTVTATVRRLMAQAGADVVMLLWAPIPHDNVAGYRVYRSTTESEPRNWAALLLDDETPDTVFEDTNVEPTTYYYRVSFVDILGNESGYSAPKEVVANTIIMSIPYVWGEPGDQVRVPINLGNARGLTPKDMFISLQFDTDWATYVEVKPTPLTAAVDFLPDASTPGIVNIISQDSNASLPGGEGRFFDLYLNLKTDAPESCAEMTLGNGTVLADSEGKPIAIQANPGSLCVGTGTWGDLDEVPGITESDATVALKIAVEELVLEPADPRNLFGDLNGDGMIDAADAVMILRMARNLSINPETNAKGKEAQFTPRQLTLGQVSSPKGCVVTMPVALDNISALAGMDLVVSFPRQDLECVAVRTTDATADFKVDSQLAAGYARISLGEAEALGGGEADVLELDFLVTGDVTSTDKPAPIVKLNYAELKGELGESFRWYADVAKTNGQVTILAATTCPVDPEGSVEGQLVEGTEPEGQTPDGEPAEGVAPEGRQPEGEAVEGETVDGEPIDGAPVEGAKPEGQSVTEGQTPPTDDGTPATKKGCFG